MKSDPTKKGFSFALWSLHDSAGWELDSKFIHNKKNWILSCVWDIEILFFQLQILRSIM
jgi:hypothetical protein